MTMLLIGHLPFLSLAFRHSHSVSASWNRHSRSILPILPILPMFMVTKTREEVETETDRRTATRRTNDSNNNRRRNSSSQEDSTTTSTTSNNKEGRQDGPLEYLQDPNESRQPDDPFHILLLGETFDKPKITLNYVTGNLQYILAMPYDDAIDASMVAQDFGMSCLGTWSRDECLTLGKALQVRDLCVRVVPFVAGGNRSWQSKSNKSQPGNKQEAFRTLRNADAATGIATGNGWD